MSDAHDAERLASIRRFYAHVPGVPDSDYSVLLRCLDAAEQALATHRDRAVELTQQLAVALAERDEARCDAVTLRDAMVAELESTEVQR